MIKNSDLSFPKMKNNIEKAGNLFYQYRACRQDASTIYDIENIRHNVVFARTPLQMNDPFDSMVGFSAEKIYDECIDLAFDQVDASLDPDLKLLIKTFLKHRVLGDVLGFIEALNKMKKYIFTQSIISHIPSSNIQNFIISNAKRLYKKCPVEIKRYFNEQSFLLFSLIVKEYQHIDIEEKTIVDSLKMEKALSDLEEKVIEVRDKTYLPFLKDFLSKMTVTCFSASGWDNQLMWSHYANSYSGICVEYDFAKMNNFIGFMYPVEYSCERPTVTLKDMGLISFEKDEDGNLKTTDPNMSAIISYLLAKNKCWEYEDEWRIINFGDKPYSPIFIDVPFIKSITFGVNIDDMCKQLLWDVCQENNIDCFQILIASDNYLLSRKQLNSEDFLFDEKKELRYINMLSDHILSLGSKIESNVNILTESTGDGEIDFSSVMNILKLLLDFLSDAYFLKISFNRYCKNMNLKEADIMSDDNVMTAVTEIINVIYQVQLSSDPIKELSLNLVSSNRITWGDYHSAIQLNNNISEMIEKHSMLEWFGIQPDLLVSQGESTNE